MDEANTGIPQVLEDFLDAGDVAEKRRILE